MESPFFILGIHKFQTDIAKTKANYQINGQVEPREKTKQKKTYLKYNSGHNRKLKKKPK